MGSEVKNSCFHKESTSGGLYLKNVLGTVFSNFRVRSFGVKSLGVFREQPLDGRGLGSGVNKSSIKIFILHSPLLLVSNSNLRISEVYISMWRILHLLYL